MRHLIKKKMYSIVVILTFLIVSYSNSVVYADEELIDVNAIHEAALSIISYYQSTEYKTVYHNMQPVYVPNYGVDGEITEQDGYAVAVSNVQDGRVNWTAYLDSKYGLVNNNNGYAVVEYEYPNNKPDLQVARYYKNDGHHLEMGSGYLHDFFMSIKDKNVTVFIAVRDEASKGVTEAIEEDMHNLGIKSNLIGKYRYGLYAVVTPENVIEDLSQKWIMAEGVIGNSTYKIESAGYETGDKASIMIDGVEYSKNLRGLNIVVYDNELNLVVDSFSIDTHMSNMPVFR